MKLLDKLAPIAMPKATVGERIRYCRQRAGMSQKKLGNLIGLAESNVRRYETDKLNPKPATIEKFALALGVSVGYLTDGRPRAQDYSERPYISDKSARLEINIDSDLLEACAGIAASKQMSLEDYVEDTLFWEREKECEDAAEEEFLEQLPEICGETKNAPDVGEPTPRAEKEAEAIRLIRGLDDYQIELLMLYLATLAGGSQAASQAVRQEGIE